MSRDLRDIHVHEFVELIKTASKETVSIEFDKFSTASEFRRKIYALRRNLDRLQPEGISTRLFSAQLTAESPQGPVAVSYKNYRDFKPPFILTLAPYQAQLRAQLREILPRSEGSRSAALAPNSIETAQPIEMETAGIYEFLSDTGEPKP